MSTNTRSLINHFGNIRDPRIDRRRAHKLIDIIVISICAVVAGADSFEEIEIIGNAHKSWLKTFLELPNGIPSHDTFARVWARINPNEFRASFATWVREIAEAISDRVGQEVISLDGQTMRGARRRGEKKSAIHMVSAWAAGLRIVLAQTVVPEKTNEISVIPDILRLLDINGCIVTMDAMGCQQTHTQQIIDQKGDYVIGLKGNQSSTLAAVEGHFAKLNVKNLESYKDTDKGHGRIETRSYFAADVNDVCDLKNWPGLQSVIKVVSTRDINDVVSTETRYYISSLPSKSVKQSGDAIRKHWGIENSLHYVLDVVFKQDKSRIRKDNAPENFGVLRQIALNILRGAPFAKNSSPSNNLKRKRAAADTEYLAQVMCSAGLEKATI